MNRFYTKFLNTLLNLIFSDLSTLCHSMFSEREEMALELSHLYDSMMELHNNMTMEIQVLEKENQNNRLTNNNKKNGNSSEDSDARYANCFYHEKIGGFTSKCWIFCQNKFLLWNSKSVFPNGVLILWCCLIFWFLIF